jgi:hypothetical protein
MLALAAHQHPHTFDLRSMWSPQGFVAEEGSSVYRSVTGNPTGVTMQDARCCALVIRLLRCT